MLEAAKMELFTQLECFDELLLTRTFIVGERMSLADISVAMDLLPAYQVIIFICGLYRKSLIECLISSVCFE